MDDDTTDAAWNQIELEQRELSEDHDYNEWLNTLEHEHEILCESI